jgi:hypothetical protein
MRCVRQKKRPQFVKAVPGRSRSIGASGCIRTMRGDPGFRQWVLYLISIFDSSSLCREAKFLVRLADCAMLSSAPLSSPA